MANKRNKRNKKSCALKRKHALVRGTIGDWGVIYLMKLGKCFVLDLKKLTIHTPTSILADALQNTPFHWDISVSVLTEIHGDKGISSVGIKSSHAHYQRNLSGICTEHHISLIKSLNRNHITGVGWIGIPNGDSLTDDQMVTAFNNLGAWGDAKQTKADIDFDSLNCV